jgi:hypothetical protein
MSKTLPQTELVLADATGSTGGLGKVGVVVATSGTLLVRCPNEGWGRSEYVDWRIKSDQAWGYTLFRSHVLPTATITMAEATRADDTDTFILNGLTYTAETTAGDAAWASRKWKAGGADADADVVALCALLNADYSIVPDGSVAVGDTIVVTTTCDGHGTEPCPGHSYTYTAAAAPSYATRVFDQSGNQAAELASIVLALNHKRNVTLASCAAGTTITITGQNGKKYTYTAHATTTTAANREFSISGTNSQDGDELVTCLNDATYGVPGYTASNASGVVSIARNSASVPEPVLSSSNGTTAACVNVNGGVPGIVAAATGATGELAVTPTWVKSVTITASPITHITVTDIDLPGILATSATHVITITPGTPGQPSGCDRAYVMQFAQGTSDANEIAFAFGTTSFAQDGAAVTGKAANASTSAGEIIAHTPRGWAHAYLLYANGAGSDATVTIGATKY